MDRRCFCANALAMSCWEEEANMSWWQACSSDNNPKEGVSQLLGFFPWFFSSFQMKSGHMGKNSQTFNYVFYTLKNSYTFSFQSTNEGKQGFLSQWHNQLSHLQRGTKTALGRDVTRTLGDGQWAQGTERRDGSQATCTVPGWNHCQGCKGLWWNADSKPGKGLGPSIPRSPQHHASRSSGGMLWNSKWSMTHFWLVLENNLLCALW